MACLVLLRNPLTPTSKEVFALEPSQPVIDYLQEHHPTGFGMPIKFYVNGDERELDDLDYVPKEDDVIVIALMPGGFLAAMPLLVKVVIGLAVMAAAFFAMQLFAPKVKKPKAAEEKEVYSIDEDQNGARYGEPLPVVYGDVWATPDYVTQPHSWYSWQDSVFDETLSGVQYLDLIMCVGQGSVAVPEIKVGSSNASVLGSSVVAWRTFQPWEHQSRMGVIKAAMGGNFHENVITSTEVENQEFIKRDDTTPFYNVSKTGAVGRLLEVDVIFPNGLYKISSQGKTRAERCYFTISWVEIDANGNAVGPVSSLATYAQSWIRHHSDSPNNKAEYTNPIRRTYTINTGKSAKWAVKITRNSINLSADEGMTTFVWSGLKLIVDDAPKAYGNVTLLAVRIKASRGVGGEGAVRVTARCQRWLNGLPSGEWQHSTSPADAFYDIYTNTTYGAGRPVGELDLTQLRSLKTKWAGYAFNHVFKDRTTVWEALKTTVIGQAAEPLPLGSTMSIAQDGVKSARSMLFTDANIVEGTMKVNYLFDIEEDYDGIEVQYIDPVDWKESFVRYPTSSVVPEQVTLAGCTSAIHAAQYARLVWQRTRKQRKRVNFDTELEGIILQLGDRIAISHEMPRWGDNGLVLAVAGNQVTLDHDVDWSGSGNYIMFRKADGTPSDMFPVTKGGQSNIAVLGSPINFTPHFDDDYDYTAFVFGKATTIVRDFTVASARHSGDTTVSVEAVNYAPEIFDGTMPFLGGVV